MFSIVASICWMVPDSYYVCSIAALSMYATSMYNMLLCFIAYLSVIFIIVVWKCFCLIHIAACPNLQLGSCLSKFPGGCYCVYVYLFTCYESIELFLRQLSMSDPDQRPQQPDYTYHILLRPGQRSRVVTKLWLPLLVG